VNATPYWRYGVLSGGGTAGVADVASPAPTSASLATGAGIRGDGACVDGAVWAYAACGERGDGKRIASVNTVLAIALTRKAIALHVTLSAVLVRRSGARC
jgi:hypothetical protein